MNTYLLRIDNKYFVRFKDQGGVILTNKISEAKRIEGTINLKSYFSNLCDYIRYGDFEFNTLEIVRIEK